MLSELISIQQAAFLVSAFCVSSLQCSISYRIFSVSHWCHARAQVVDAMSQTIRNYLGTLLPQFFQVSISAKGEDLAQLMYTMMMSGYMFRNAHYRLELRDSMLPSGAKHTSIHCASQLIAFDLGLLFLSVVTACHCCVCTLTNTQVLLSAFHVPVQGIKALMSMICLLPCQSWGCWIIVRTASMPQVHKRHVCLVKY